MKKLFTLLLVLGLAAGLTACSKSDDEAPDTDAPNAEEQPKKDIYEIGETAEVDGIKFTVTQTREDEGIVSAGEGMMYFVIEVAIENTNEDSFSSSSLMCYELKDGDGRKMDISIGANLNGSLDTTVDANDKSIGEIAFKTAKEGELTLKITPSFGDSVKFKVR